MLEMIRSLTGNKELLTSQLFNELTFDQAFWQDLRCAKKSIVIESPYLTERRARYFAPLFNKLTKRKVKIRINTRHPRYHSPAMATQAQKASKILLDSKVRLYTYHDLRHRKLAIIDNTVLWEGSMNILSHNRSREIMRRSNSKILCRRMICFANIHY